MRGGASDMDAIQTDDTLGKIPLAMQQLALAATRLDELGDSAGAKRVRQKMDELLAKI